jgi:DNA replication protein DnaC
MPMPTDHPIESNPPEPRPSTTMTQTAQPSRGLLVPFQARDDTCPDCGVASQATRFVRGAEEDAQKPWTRHRCGDCSTREETRARADHERDMQASKLREHLAALAVPPLYAGATLETFRLTGDEQNRALQTRTLQLARRFVGSWPEVPMIVVCLGVPGSGKGHVVWAIGRALIEAHGASVRVAVLSDVIRDLREAWGAREDGGLSEAQRLAKYRGADLLVIDEVSRHAFYGQPQQHLYDLVAWRELQFKPTILTTNETGESLAEFLGPALSSRALGWGQPWAFGTVDYRLSAGMSSVSSVAGTTTTRRIA